MNLVKLENNKALTAASADLRARILEVAENLDSFDDFKLPKAKVTSDGFELYEDVEPLESVTGVLIHAGKLNIYYDEPYNPNAVKPPTCFSTDGRKPDDTILEPQNATCKGCPQAQWGTNSMKSGKACRNIKPMYMLIGDSIMPRQIAVSPTSLKAANEYLLGLTESGISYFKIKTVITAYKENSKDTYSKLKFSRGEKLSVDEIKDVEALRESWREVIGAQAIDIADVAEEMVAGRETVVEDSGKY